MIYLKFWNEFTDSFYDGYKIRENNQYFWIVPPLAYEWLSFIDHKTWLLDIHLDRYEKKLFPYVIPQHQCELYTNDSWVFNYPVTKKDLHEFTHISAFFESFLYLKNLSFLERLELSVKRFEKHLNQERLKDLILFILKQERYKQDHLRLVFSKVLSPYLGGDWIEARTN